MESELDEVGSVEPDAVAIAFVTAAGPRQFQVRVMRVGALGLFKTEVLVVPSDEVSSAAVLIRLDIGSVPVSGRFRVTTARTPPPAKFAQAKLPTAWFWAESLTACRAVLVTASL
jgi:hypothetical protein